MSRTRRYIIYAIALLFALLVWPTPYRYDKARIYGAPFRQEPTLVRVNRISGSAQELTAHGWKWIAGPWWESQHTAPTINQSAAQSLSGNQSKQDVFDQVDGEQTKKK